ncbi:hypothetical protein [Shinella sumterensis]|uniref:DUF3102 domain-containing protein n=1 Tax=Shinella sumterensis TaxID=1967501 RepID=A0AA50H3A4_9HYPH|nr:hypothetical protein [Shinella sumterensis]WLR96209.1 hypothetical protein Q9313_10770 [Shinella sumterensis]
MRKTRKADPKPKKEPVVAIPAEHEPLLTEVHDAVKAMGRRTTGQAYELGYQLARAKAVLPEKMFGRWTSTVCGYTPRQGRNYVAIHEHLQEHRERLEGAAVVPTVLFVLASAKPEKIEAVLAVVESGERLTVGQVKNLIKDGDEGQPERKAAIGGLAGLRRAAEAKLKDELTQFIELSKRILKAAEPITELLEKGKHVSKKSLADKVEVDAYKAAGLLRSAIFPERIDASRAANPGADDALLGWGGVPALFGRLGDSPRWPGKDEFPTWVTGTVLPMLRFVVHGDPLPGAHQEAAPSPTDDAAEETGTEARLTLEDIPALEGPSEEDYGDAADSSAASDEEAPVVEAEPEAPEKRRAMKESLAGV